MEAPKSASIDGFDVFGFPSVAAAANWILQTPDRPNIGVALNAEKVITARRQPGVLEPLKDVAFFYPDGLPITWVLKDKGVPSARVPGVELWEELMRQAGERKVYILGAAEDVNRDTETRLREELGLTNVRRHNGFFDDDDAVIDDIAAYQPEICSVALGSPRQEQFMLKARERCPDTYFMGVGGTYNVFTGREERAPKWMGDRGLEWFYRLLQHPKRWRRNLTYFVFMWNYWLGRF